MKQLTGIKIVVALSFVLITHSCINSKTDDEMLERDKKELTELLDTEKVLFYKFGKLILRSYPVPPDENPFDAAIYPSYAKLVKLNMDSLSLVDYVTIFKEYRRLREIVQHENEDNYPTLSETFLPDLLEVDKEQFVPGNDEEKVFFQALEHGVLSVLVLASRDLGREIALYECSKTQPDCIVGDEIKSAFQLYRSLVFLDQKLFYLSEKEVTDVIDWLDSDAKDDFVFTRTIFADYTSEKDDARLIMHCFSHLLRGLDRLMMPRDIDEERALADFSVFLEDAHRLGLANELVYSIEAYVALKNENTEKAIVALKYLEGSSLLSEKEKSRISETIDYLEKRESDKALNGVYDKMFISKISVRYLFAWLKEIDWEQVLIENDVPVNDQFCKTLDKMNELSEKADDYLTVDSYTDKGMEVATDLQENVEEESKKMWNKAKGFISE
jgi:hypothetical protein